ncbi:MAG: rod shape-determining protein MreD [Bacteroidales bacterium]|nr:rod shape-determining protein MreD [Bacteroidales bacterium]
MNIYVSRFFWFLVVLALQVLVLNHVNIMGYAMPLAYVYYLLIMPSGVSRALLLLWGFVGGFVFDLFANTPGIGAASMTLVALIQPKLIVLMSDVEEDEVIIPSRKVMGRIGYFLYLLMMALLVCTLFFALESFAVTNGLTLLKNIGGSTALTTLIFLALESIRSQLDRKD